MTWLNSFSFAIVCDCVQSNKQYSITFKKKKIKLIFFYFIDARYLFPTE